MRFGRNKNGVHKCSRYEALCVVKVLFFLSSEEVYEPSVILTLTPYNTHRNASLEALGMMSTPEVPCCNDRAQTITRFQVDERQAIILSARRHTTRQSARSSLEISSLEHIVHIAVTRAILHLSFAGDIQFLRSKSDVWSRVHKFAKKRGTTLECTG